MWQKAQTDKQKHEKTEKHALRPTQHQHAATALTLGEDKSTDEYALHTSEGEREDLDGGIYVKT